MHRKVTVYNNKTAESCLKCNVYTQRFCQNDGKKMCLWCRKRVHLWCEHLVKTVNTHSWLYVIIRDLCATSVPLLRITFPRVKHLPSSGILLSWSSEVASETVQTSAQRPRRDTSVYASGVCLCVCVCGCSEHHLWEWDFSSHFYATDLEISELNEVSHADHLHLSKHIQSSLCKINKATNADNLKQFQQFSLLNWCTGRKLSEPDSFLASIWSKFTQHRLHKNTFFLKWRDPINPTVPKNPLLVLLFVLF